MKSDYRILLAIFLAMAAFQAQPAWAGDFDERKSEALNTLAQLPIEEPLKVQIKDKLEKYFNFREKVLSDSYPLLQEQSTSNREQANRWKEHFDRATQEATKQIYDMLHDAMPRPLLLFLTQFATLEAAFFAKLMSMPAGSLRDIIVIQRDVFDKERSSLEGKWREMGSNDQSIDSQARDAQRSLSGIYQDMLKNVTGNITDAESLATVLVKVGQNIPGMPEKAQQLLEMLEKALETLAAMGNKKEAYNAKLDEICKNEQRIIILFSNTRGDVQAFLEKMNFEKLRLEYQVKVGEINEKARSMNTPGQQTDAARFASRITLILQGHLEDFEDCFEKFVNQFDHIFFNSLGDRTIDELIERQEWNKWTEEIRAVKLQQALENCHRNLDRCLEIDINTINDPTVKEQIAKLREKLQPLQKRVKNEVENEKKYFTFMDRLKILLELMTKK